RKGLVVQVKVRGKRVTGSNGNATFSLVMGSTGMCTSVLPPTTLGNSAFEIDFEILCYEDGNFQRASAFGRQEGASDTITGGHQTADRAENWVTSDNSLVLRFTPAHASDEIII